MTLNRDDNAQALRDHPTVVLRGSDFTEPPEPKKQANTLIFGDAGNGKTTFAIAHAPAPVALISYDRRGDHAAARHNTPDHRIFFTRVEYPADPMGISHEKAKEIGKKAIDKTIKNMEVAVNESKRGNVRTIVLDTGTEYDTVLKLGIRGRTDKIKGDYGQSKDLINQNWWRILNMARDGSANLIVLARAKAVWEDNEPTGEFAPRINEVVLDGVDWATQIKAVKRSGIRKRDGKLPVDFELKITKAGINIEVLHNVYREDDWEPFGPFVWACCENYPGTTPDDWS